MNIRKFVPARGIGAYLALAFAGLSILLTAILAQVVATAASSHVRTNIGHGLAELAVQTADKLDRGMYERYREVQLMAMRRDLTSPDVAPELKREVLNARQDTYPYYAWIGLVAPDGVVQVSTHGLLEGANVAQRPWFRNAIDGVYVGDVHEAVLLAKLLPNRTGEPMRFVDIAFPYSDPASGTLRGVLGVHLSWQWAADVERSVFEPITQRLPVQAMIVGADGNVLLGPEGLQGTKLEQPSLRAALQGRGYATERWADGREYLVGYSRTDGHGSYPGLEWTVLVRQPLEEAFAPVRDIQRLVLWSGIGLALLFSLLGWLAARRITQPLRELARSAQRIRAGEALEVAADPHSYSEIKALAGSLNALVSNLLRKESDLRELNQTLEDKVVLRTRELEQALNVVQASERRIQTIIASAQDAFVAVGLDGRVIDWNAQAERMFGWSAAEAVGRDLASLVLPERFHASYRDGLQRFRATGDIPLLGRRLERLVLDRTGREFPVEVSIGMAGAGNNAFFSAFLHDISERKQTERMKSEFISTVSHELRTPLTSIRASLAMLVDDMRDELTPGTSELLDIAYRSCERLVRLVNDILDIEKIESGKMQFDLRAQPLGPLIRQAMESTQGYAEQYRVSVEFDDQSSTALVPADHDRMIQVFVNLLSNAIKYSNSGARVLVRCQMQGNTVITEVCDQGSGIPLAFRGRVFQKFAQADASDSRRKGGTGLGLAICKSIVEQHGGQIGFDSEEGRGTTFRVVLPLA